MTSSTGTLADLERVLSALRRSHDRLMAAAAPLAAEEVTADSYDDDWSIAQVLSHLGSGAEIFSLMVEAGVRGDPAPGPDVFRPVWDRWNAMPPVEQVRTALSADAALVARLGALSEAERERWRLDMFGSEQDLAGLARMRLSEHAVHTWDVVVALQPSAPVAPEAVDLLVDSLGDLAARTGTVDEPLTVTVTTVDPERVLTLAVGPSGGSLVEGKPAAGTASGSVRLPAEALLRLVYGRLDADHTPTGISADGVDLDDLRAAFPGF